MSPIAFQDGVCARCHKAAPYQKVLCDDCRADADKFCADLRIHYVERRCLFNTDAQSGCSCPAHLEYRREAVLEREEAK